MDWDDVLEAQAAELQQKGGSWHPFQIASSTGFLIYFAWTGALALGFRKVSLQVPYVPSSAKQVQNMMSLLKGRSGKLVDLGSGDGRIVLEAYKQGFQPVIGYELNPWLLKLSHFHAWRAGCYGKVFYHQQDLWKALMMVIHAISISKLDYCNMLYMGLPLKTIWKQQLVQYAAVLFADRTQKIGSYLPWLEVPTGSGRVESNDANSVAALLHGKLHPFHADLSDCSNVTVFLAPSVVPQLENKLLSELPDEACVVAARFPFLKWTPSKVVGESLETAWAYNIRDVRQAKEDASGRSSPEEATLAPNMRSCSKDGREEA